MVRLTGLGALESCGLDSVSGTYAATDFILGHMVDQSSQPMEMEAKKQREISRAYTPIPPSKHFSNKVLTPKGPQLPKVSQVRDQTFSDGVCVCGGVFDKARLKRVARSG